MYWIKPVIKFLLLTFIIHLIFIEAPKGQVNYNKEFKVKLVPASDSAIDIARSTINSLKNSGFNYSPHFNYFSRNYSENFDFNKDGFNDLIIVFGKDPRIGSPLVVLLWDNIKKRYVEDPNYYILGHGDHMLYYDSVDDFDNDGDIDIYFPMESYHDINGFQPPYYLKNDLYMPGNLLLNNGNSFDRIYIDTTKKYYTDRIGYFDFSSASLINYDQDEKKDLIVPSIFQHPMNIGDFLATKYTIDNNKNISSEFVFPWNSASRYMGQAHSIMFKNYKNLIYAYLQPIEDYGNGTTQLYGYTYPAVWIYEKSKNGLPPVVIKKIELKRNKALLNAGQILNHDTFYITDLDKDGNEEIIIAMFNLPLSGNHFSIHVFDNMGNEITDKWILNEEFLDHTGAHATGFDVIDLNKDGYDDILFRDNFNSTSDQISMLINNGKYFEQHLINARGTFGVFNIAADPDKDGNYLILRSLRDSVINKSIISYELKIGSCKTIAKPVFNQSVYSFCSGDSLKLSVTNMNKGDTLKWYFGTKSDLSNVVSKTFTDSTRLFVTRTDSIGCIINSDTIMISKIPKPATPIISRDNNNNLISNQIGANWFKDGIKITDTTQIIKPISNGIYTVTTTQNGCTSAQSEGYYYITTSISTLSNGEYFNISPNPTSGELKINYNFLSSKEVMISVINMNGVNIISNRKMKSGDKINLRTYSKGNYIVLVKDRTGNLITSQKIVKE